MKAAGRVPSFGRAEPRRCAIYARSSVAGAPAPAAVSIPEQRRVCIAHIKQQPGWISVPDRYEDHGFSGANLRRPALTRLVADVDAHRIDVVVVQRADRLTRWYMDFVTLMDRLHRAGVAFVSVSEDFSTADAPGRRRLDMVLSFADLERAVLGAPPCERRDAGAGPR